MAMEKNRIDRILFPLLTDVLEISNRMLRIGIYYLLANILFMLIIQIAYCLKVHSKACWIKYGLFICTCLDLLATRVTFLLTSRAYAKIRNFISSEIVWDLDLTDQNTFRKIIIKRTIFKRHLMTQFFFVFWLCISSIYELCMQLDKYSVIAEYIKKRYPSLIVPSICFYVVENIGSGFVIAVFPIYLYYCCELIEMQVHIMSSHIEKFSVQLKVHGVNSSFVKNGLKKIIKQHHNLLRCNALMRKHMRTAQIILYCTMFPCTICITIMLFSNQISWFLKCGALLLHIYIGASAYHKGQLSHNLVESMCFQLYDLEWYTWDVSNMKTFLLLITNTLKQLNWSAITQTKAINYESFNEVVKLSYTMYNFIRTCKH